MFGSVETNSTVRTKCFTFEREIQNDIYHLNATNLTHLTIEGEKRTIYIYIYMFLLLSYVTSNEKKICANMSNSNS